MRAHPGELGVIEEGLHALGYMLETGDPKALADVKADGGVAILQKAKEIFMDKKFVTYFASAALEQLWGPPSDTPERSPEPEPEPVSLATWLGALVYLRYLSRRLCFCSRGLSLIRMDRLMIALCRSLRIS